MKTTLGQIYNNWAAIGKLSAIDLPAKQAYGLARFLKDASTHYEEVERLRTTIVTRYGTADDAGNVTVQSEKMPEFLQEFGDLLATEVDVYDPALTVEHLSEAKLSALTFFGLTWLIDRPGDSA